MYEVADADVAAGTVVDVIQAGYVIGDRVLRPALVAIAKAPRPPANDNRADRRTANRPKRRATSDRRARGAGLRPRGGSRPRRSN